MDIIHGWLQIALIARMAVLIAPLPLTYQTGSHCDWSVGDWSCSVASSAGWMQVFFCSSPTLMWLDLQPCMCVVTYSACKMNHTFSKWLGKIYCIAVVDLGNLKQMWVMSLCVERLFSIRKRKSCHSYMLLTPGPLTRNSSSGALWSGATGVRTGNASQFQNRFVFSQWTNFPLPATLPCINYDLPTRDVIWYVFLSPECECLFLGRKDALSLTAAVAAAAFMVLLARVVALRWRAVGRLVVVVASSRPGCERRLLCKLNGWLVG